MELVGLAEIAELAGVSRQAVSNWVVRHSGFPAPLAKLAAGPVWERAPIVTWLRTQGLMPSTEESMRFRVGQRYAHADLIEAFGGEVKGGIFLPTRDGKIVCGCITPEMNPDAPDCILLGNKSRVLARAEKMAAQAGAIPMFLKRGVNQWEYQGLYEFTGLSRAPDNFREAAVRAGRLDIVAALFFRPSETNEGASRG